MTALTAALCTAQCPAKHQMTIHGVLGIPMHKVVVHTKRIGGGFGGKVWMRKLPLFASAESQA